MGNKLGVGRGMPGWLLLLGALTVITPLSIDMYLPAFAVIAGDLRTDQAHIELTLAVFLVGMAVGQLVYGPLSDRFGRKPPLRVGLAIYIVASLGCAYADTLSELTVWRFIQALGGAAGLVITRAVIRDRTSVLEGARAFSLLTLVTGLAPILAPLLGGAVLAVSGWRTIFLVLAGFAVVLLAGTHRTMQETVAARERPPLGFMQVLRQCQAVFGDRGFVVHTLAAGLAFGGLFAYIAGSPRVLIGVYHLSPQEFAWVFALNAAGLVAGAQINARIVGTHGMSALVRRGIYVLPIAALVALVPAVADIRSLPLLVASQFVYLSSLGFIGPNANAMALAEQRKQAGTASALSGTVQFLLGTIAGVVMSLWGGATALPLTTVMFVCGVLACVVLLAMPDSSTADRWRA